MDKFQPTSQAGKFADLAIILAAASLVVFMFMQALPASDQLWRDALHDRNGHYSFGLKLAVYARELEIARFVGELAKAKVWPPVHGLLLSFVLLVGGLDHRLGIIPSLFGWALTIAFCWKIAMRCFDDTGRCVAAGLLAMALVATSPALALISGDVMLEGLGSGLSALCLWAFMAAYAEPEKTWRWRLLGIALTILFFEKYNYWAFAAASLALTACMINQSVRSFVRVSMRMAPAAGLLLVRLPAFLIGMLFLAIALAISLRGPTEVALFGQAVSLYPPRNVVTMAYAMVFVAAVQLWRIHRPAIRNAIGHVGSVLLAWHVVPVAASFLLPGRLFTFVWFLGPSNSMSANQLDFLRKLALYRVGLFEGFFSLPAIGWGCIFLFLVAVLSARKLRLEARVVLVFVGVSALALLVHPQAQPRFLSTSVFALFVGAGAGFAILTRFVVPRFDALRLTIGAAVPVAVLVAQLWLPYPPAAYPTAIRRMSNQPSDLDLVRLYEPFVAKREGLAVAATFGPSSLLWWPLTEACECTPKIEQAAFDPAQSRNEVAAAGKRWLETIDARQAVIADLPDYPPSTYRHENTVGLVDAVAMQSRFRIVREIQNEALNARVLILERR